MTIHYGKQFDIYIIKLYIFYIGRNQSQGVQMHSDWIYALIGGMIIGVSVSITVYSLHKKVTAPGE